MIRNNIDKIYSKSANQLEFAKGYLEYLSTVINKIDLGQISEFIKEIEISREDESTIFVAGNGGSAATASHMVNDIGTDVMRKSEINNPFRIMALTDNNALMTAIGNDVGYDNLFLYQLRLYFKPGDKLILISASGNSRNLIEAAEWTKKRGGKVIGLLGFDGGKLKSLCDLVVQVETPKGEYGPVEDLHMILNHILSNWLIMHLKSGN